MTAGAGVDDEGAHVVTQWVRGDAGDVGVAPPPPAASTAALDLALRHLVHVCRAGRRPLPAFPVATVTEKETGATVELRLAAPLGPPPPGWEGEAEAWWCRPDALGEVPPAPPAYPAVVPVGRGREVGAVDGVGGDVVVAREAHDVTVWVDLGLAPGLLTVEAEEDTASAVLAGIGAALAPLPWAGGVRVWEVADLDDLPVDVAERCMPVPVLGGVDGRWGAPPRGGHDVVLLTRAATPEVRAAIRAAARRRDAPTVLAPVRPGDGPARGAWNWRVEGRAVTW